MKENFLEEIRAILQEDSILVNEPMCAHTTFRVGGNVDYLLSPQTEEEAVALLRLFYNQGVDYVLLGNGSNVLVSDEGIRGFAIAFDSNFGEISIINTEITAQAGALLVKIASEAYKAGLGGLEFASGIPGSLGGAVTMNAGAYGGEMKNVVKSVRLFDRTVGEVVTKSCEEMEFSYRNSLAKSGRYVVLSAQLTLQAAEPGQIKARMDELRDQRVLKQPLEYPSAGSTFKRPEGYFAGKLIEDSGLKGYCVGGAQVSEKHAGFVINRDNATAEDVYRLIEDVRRIVYEQQGVELEPEVCMIGFENREDEV